MKRYQFDAPPVTATRIEEMKELIGARTNGEIFDNALTLLDWAITNAQDNRLIASMSEDERSHRLLTMPAIERVRRSAQKSNNEAAAMF